MAMGGIPYYWSLLKKKWSLDQNIDNLFFKYDAPLRNEYEALYASLFKYPEPYMKVVVALGKERRGMQREEILNSTKLSDNQSFATILRDLEQCGFIRKYMAPGKKTRGAFFQLIDKEELCDIENDKIFWEKTRTFILKKNKGKTGTFLKDYVSEFDFTNRNIYKLKKLIYGNEDKLKPLYYENINKTTGLIIFIIKDSFEYCGIFRNNKKTMPSMVLHYLEYLLDNLNILKKYIDELKKFMNQ
jgi:hypothetical protein